MKKYQSHKIVHGGLIIGVEEKPLDNIDYIVIHVQGENKPFQFDRSFIARGTPVKNESYLVLYNKGTDKEYYSWCPKDIFKEGNHPADEDEPTVTLQITDRRVLQQIREDAKDQCRLLRRAFFTKGDLWIQAWSDLERVADLLDAMMARSEVGFSAGALAGKQMAKVIEVIELAYKDLEKALASGKCVERCTIDQGCIAVDWHRVIDISRAFHPNRYRINDCDVTNKPESGDFVTKWIPTDELGNMAIKLPQESGIERTINPSEAVQFDTEDECDDYCRNRGNYHSVSYRVKITDSEDSDFVRVRVRGLTPLN